MAFALAVKKDDHTPRDLRRLAQAPYFDAHLIKQRPDEDDGRRRRRRRRRPLKLEELSDEDLLPPGTLIHSHGIAPSTREALEQAMGCKLPRVATDRPEALMSAEELRKLLNRHRKLHSDESIGHLYRLLKTAAELGFEVGWYEGLEESQPRGWR